MKEKVLPIQPVALSNTEMSLRNSPDLLMMILPVGTSSFIMTF